MGPNLFVSGISSNIFNASVSPDIIGRQRRENWCWAATVQMVLNYYRLNVTQEMVVQRIFGNLDDRPGQPSEILAALSGWAPNYNGGMSFISAAYFNSNSPELIRALENNNPLIVGLRNPGQSIGHAYVLTAIKYSFNQYNQPIPHSVGLRDPWPNSESLIEVPWSDFSSRLMFSVIVSVNRLQ